MIFQQGKVRPESVTTILELSEWALAYHKNHPAGQGVLQRFAIGLYQIHQGMSWAETPSRSESYAAAAIHFCAVSELLGCDHLHGHIFEIESGPIDFRALLYAISQAQQHVVYYTNGEYFKGRNKRFSQNAAGCALKYCVNTMIKAICIPDRAEAIDTAMRTMTGAR